MTHAYHQGLEGYSPDQIFVDYCEECESRAASFSLSHMDADTWNRAKIRALKLNREGLDKASKCEAPVLRVIGDILIREQAW